MKEKQKKLRLKLIGDGGFHTSKVVDADTGRIVEGVTGISIDYDYPYVRTRIEIDGMEHILTFDNFRDYEQGYRDGKAGRPNKFKEKDD
jgi:hypothetical protein